MHTGISTACLYPMETEKALRTVLDLGFKKLEIFINAYSEMNHNFIKSLKDMADEYGAKIISIHPFSSVFETLLLFSNYPRRLEDGYDFYRKFAEIAQILGTKFTVLHGSRNFKLYTNEEYYERFATVSEIFNEYGITLAQENVYMFRGQDPEFLSSMRKYLNNNVSFVFDVKQAIRAGYDPFEVLKAMGDRVAHIHVNDNNIDIGRDCMLPGKGKMDYKKLNDYLRQIDYKGEWIIEVYRQDFTNIDELAEAGKFLDQYIV